MSQMTTSSPRSDPAVVTAMAGANPAAIDEIAAKELARLMAKQAIARPPVNIQNGVLMPEGLDGMRRLAEVLWKSGRTPQNWIVTNRGTPEDNYEGTIAQSVICIALAYRVGKDWIWAIQWVMIVNNRPSIWGDGLPDLVFSSGRCEGFEEGWTDLDGNGQATDRTRAYTVITRKGIPTPYRYEFSVADAKKAGLWGKSGPWSNYSKRQLQMRARAFCVRGIMPDALGGAAVVEEQLDIPTTINSERVADITERIASLNTSTTPTATTTPQEPAAPAASHETAGDGEGPQHGTTTREEAEEFAALSGLKVQAQGSLLGDDKPNTGTVDTKRRK